MCSFLTLQKIDRVKRQCLLCDAATQRLDSLTNGSNGPGAALKANLVLMHSMREI
jgi:hypothetical protein